MRQVAPIVLTAALLAGCIGRPANPAATQPATAIDPATTQPSYWMDQPSETHVVAKDFQKTWDGCETVARRYYFTIDRRDYRHGMLTTVPMISAQLHELWRDDTVTWFDRTEASLTNIRRTITFQFSRNDDQSYTVTPKVLVERMSRVDPKLRGEVNYPMTYWTPIRRDAAFEKLLAADLQKTLDH